MRRLLLVCLIASVSLSARAGDRSFWVETMTRIATPVLENLAAGTLKADMPFESLSTDPLRKEVSYLEAFGRTVCGIAPGWNWDRTIPRKGSFARSIST